MLLKKLTKFKFFRILIKAGILFIFQNLAIKNSNSSRGIQSSTYNFKVALDKIDAGAPIEGEILASVMHMAEAVLDPDVTSIDGNKVFLDRSINLLKKLNSNDDNKIRAYSALVVKIWPAITDSVTDQKNSFF